MVMIPVGNRTSHCFRIWCFAEIYVRMVITTVVLINLQDTLSVNQLRFIASLFFVWAWRPLYLSLKSLYSTWRDAKHRAESDALHATGEQNG